MPRINDGPTSPDAIRIFDTSGCEHLAEVIPLDRETARTEITAAWWNSVRDLPKEVIAGEHDRRWNWHKLIGTMRTQLGKLGFARAVWHDGAVQGAIIFQVAAISELEAGAPSLMVYRLATAPWNRDWLSEKPRYRGIGSGLLRLAAEHSRRYGSDGRVTVESYSDAALLDWYRRLGFVIAVPDDGEVCVLELPPSAADDLLEE